MLLILIHSEFGHDSISIRMLQIYGKSIRKPLKNILKSCFEKGCFPSDWKKANVVPVHKKVTKQLLRNYRTLLPISGKNLRKISP